MTAAIEGGEWSAARPGRTLPPGKTRYPFYRRLGGPQGRSERAENLVPTGIRSRTVQPVAQSLYRLSHPAHRNNTITVSVTTTHNIVFFLSFNISSFFIFLFYLSPPITLVQPVTLPTRIEHISRPSFARKTFCLLVIRLLLANT